jgi:hypothetical protein
MNLKLLADTKRYNKTGYNKESVLIHKIYFKELEFNPSIEKFTYLEHYLWSVYDYYMDDEPLGIYKLEIIDKRTGAIVYIRDIMY